MSRVQMLCLQLCADLQFVYTSSSNATYLLFYVFVVYLTALSVAQKLDYIAPVDKIINE
jgi:hypothetical protein